MGSLEGAEPESSFNIPKLQLLLIPPILSSPEHSGMLTPPLQTLASVPFRWEQEPGKPRPCTTLITLPPNNNINGPKCLDLPPRLLVDSKITVTPSPSSTVLDCPDGNKSFFSSSSFRFLTKGGGGSFHSTGWSPEKGQLGGTMVLGKRSGNKRRGIFESWGQKTLNLVGRGKRQVGGGSFIFPSSMDVAYCSDGDSGSKRVKMGIRSGSFSTRSQSRSQFWEAMYEGFKKAVPWSRKSKKDDLAT